MESYSIDDASVVIIRFKNDVVATLSSVCFLEGENLPSEIKLSLYGRVIMADIK